MVADVPVAKELHDLSDGGLRALGGRGEDRGVDNLVQLIVTEAADVGREAPMVLNGLGEQIGESRRFTIGRGVERARGAPPLQGCQTR